MLKMEHAIDDSTQKAEYSTVAWTIKNVMLNKLDTQRSVE